MRSINLGADCRDLCGLTSFFRPVYPCLYPPPWLNSPPRADKNNMEGSPYFQLLLLLCATRRMIIAYTQRGHFNVMNYACAFITIFAVRPELPQ